MEIMFNAISWTPQVTKLMKEIEERMKEEAKEIKVEEEEIAA